MMAPMRKNMVGVPAPWKAESGVSTPVTTSKNISRKKIIGKEIGVVIHSKTTEQKTASVHWPWTPRPWMDGPRPTARNKIRDTSKMPHFLIDLPPKFMIVIFHSPGHIKMYRPYG